MEPFLPNRQIVKWVAVGPSGLLLHSCLMRKVKTHIFNGTQYAIEFSGPIQGRCDSPIGGKPAIVCYIDSKKKDGLETLIHEALHAEGWAKTEKVVERTAKEIASFLWRLGFRKCKK